MTKTFQKDVDKTGIQVDSSTIKQDAERGKWQKEFFSKDSIKNF